MGGVLRFQPAALPPLCPITAASLPDAKVAKARALIADVLGWCPAVGLRGWILDGEFHAEADKAARLTAMLGRADGVAAATQFLLERRSRRTMNRRRTSDDWRGLAEDWHAASTGRRVSIPNGCFIVAAMGIGNYRVEPVGRGPNVYLNISDQRPWWVRS